MRPGPDGCQMKIPCIGLPYLKLARSQKNFLKSPWGGWREYQNKFWLLQKITVRDWKNSMDFEGGQNGTGPMCIKQISWEKNFQKIGLPFGRYGAEKGHFFTRGGPL